MVGKGGKMFISQKLKIILRLNLKDKYEFWQEDIYTKTNSENRWCIIKYAR